IQIIDFSAPKGPMRMFSNADWPFGRSVVDMIIQCVLLTETLVSEFTIKKLMTQAPQCRNSQSPVCRGTGKWNRPKIKNRNGGSEKTFCGRLQYFNSLCKYGSKNASDLDSIRALFNEKEKELTMAVAKVEELTRQLEDVRRRRLNQPPNAPASQELERITSARDGARKYWIGGTGTGYWIGGTRMAVLDRRHRNGGIGSPVLDGGTGSAVLERRYWIGGIGSAVLDRRHWIGGTGSVVLDRRYWNSSTYWNGGTGTAILDRRNWIGGTGKAVLDRQFRIGGTGTVHAWRRWTALGMSFLVVLVVT
ncbi:unnamed protein product, partial [Nesidiocoris tenuis]